MDNYIEQITFPNYTETDLSIKKLNYINSRLGTDFTVNDAINLSWF